MAKGKNGVEEFEQMLERVFSQKGTIKSCLDKTTNDYRSLDPGRYLYGLVMNNHVKDRFSTDYIELVYTTLKSWNMDSRGARLSDFSTFTKIIRKYKSYFDDFLNGSADYPAENYRQTLNFLFEKLELTKGTSPLVTFSKTMHFFLPDLIAPIDRKYTLSFFKKNHRWTFRDKNSQFSVFMDIQNAYYLFAHKHKLEDYLDDKWNRNIPKIMDNLVIGYMLSYNKSKET